MPEVSQYKPGILIAQYPPHAIVNLDDIKREYADRRAICRTPHCLLVKLRGLALLSQEAMEFLVGPEHTELTTALAIFVDPNSGFFEHGKILLWSFKNVHNPKFKMEVFEDEKSALQWICSHCDNDD